MHNKYSSKERNVMYGRIQWFMSLGANSILQFLQYNVGCA